MTGSAKQSRIQTRLLGLDCFVAALLAMTARAQRFDFFAFFFFLAAGFFALFLVAFLAFFADFLAAFLAFFFFEATFTAFLTAFFAFFAAFLTFFTTVVAAS